MTGYFVYPCNAVNYDIAGHFSTNSKIVWRAASGIKKDDVVFIYVGKTQREIRYKCVVVSLEVSKMLLENAYAIPKGKIANRCSHLVMQKVCEYKEGTFPLEELKANGMGQFMVPMRANDNLREYLLSKDKLMDGGDE